MGLHATNAPSSELEVFVGFPLVMYLSRSRTVSIWPELNIGQEAAVLESVKYSVNLSLMPKVDIAAEWKKQERKDAPVRQSSTPWPPPDAHVVATAIEKALRSKNDVGNMADYLAGDRRYTAYKLSGTLRLEAEFDLEHPRPQLKVHGVPAQLRLGSSKSEVSLMLAFDNMAGIDFNEGDWSVWESGAMWFLRNASSEEGYPLVGLFTPEAAPPSTSCGVVYFVNADRYEQSKEYLPPGTLDTIATGIDQWPTGIRRY